jgi:L-lactate dehydrogenase complex protein LldG
MNPASHANPDVPSSAGDLIARFAREIELLHGHAIVANSETEAAAQLAALCRSGNIRSIAAGRGITVDVGSFVNPLAQAGIAIEMISADGVGDGERAAVRERIARCDLGLAEADYGIASTGTLAVSADASRPGSLTLLAPISVVVLRAERIVPDLAALFEKIGPAGVAAKRLTLISGPSRTADIEKRIVMGVHGPRELHVIMIRSWAEG